VAYLHWPGAHNAAAAWRALLLREPRTLEWPGLEKLTSRAWLQGYDFSDQVLARRATEYVVEVEVEREVIRLELGEIKIIFARPLGGLLAAHLFLKLLLNAHSTAVMARLGRCRGNLMTYVRASNLKLIDRAVRYARHLWKLETGREVPYEDAVRALFAIRPTLGPDDPAVLRMVDKLKTSANLLD
jgi:N-acetylmuramic acid 6-phosphate etherase